jgi:hypothetical protein
MTHRQTLSIVGVAVAAALFAPGCFVSKSASTGATETGEALRFRTARQRFKVKERQVTGSTDHYNASGSYVGTSERSRVVEKTKLGPREVYFYQGHERIGEADFYRIGGDLSAAREAESAQSKLWWMSIGGVALVTAGVASNVAAISGVYGEGGGATAGYVGSNTAAAAGVYLLYYAILKRHDARVDLERARGIGVAF